MVEENVKQKIETRSKIRLTYVRGKTGIRAVRSNGFRQCSRTFNFVLNCRMPIETPEQLCNFDKVNQELNIICLKIKKTSVAMSGLRLFSFIHTDCQLAIWSKHAESPLKKKDKSLFLHISRLSKGHTFCSEVRMTQPFVLLLTATSKKNVTMEYWWNDNDRGKVKRPSATLSFRI